MKRFTAVVFSVTLILSVATARSATIIDDWDSIKAPPAPTLATNVAVDAETTALLVLDIVKQTCNLEHNPDCIASLPGIHKLLDSARSAHAKVVYSLIAVSTPTNIIPSISPKANEPVVRSGPDKFLQTNLDAILRQSGIKTVIVSGTRSQGAIIATATEAAYRGYKVILPVDAESSDVPYAKQFTTWDVVNAPGTDGKISLTTIDQITFVETAVRHASRSRK